ncbi:MAG: DUF4294 domain-containing protein, partial [Lentimicrobiaceae bacterium]|nr:DUF4294 domain-containing protein [Lentimicrobiaceae bacterium]
MKRFLILLFPFFILPAALFAQEREIIVLKATVIAGDTLPQVYLPEVRILSFAIFRTPAEQRRFDRLVRNVKKVYPYARLAGLKLNEYDNLMAGLPEKEQKKLYKKAEQELKDEFGDE